MRVREARGGGMRGGERRQQGDALRSGRRVGEQPDSGGEPARGARGRALGDRLARFAQHSDRRSVAVARRVLDVVGARDGGRPARRQRLGGALVGAEPPPSRPGLVDRRPHERVAEPEPARHVGGADEVAAQSSSSLSTTSGSGTSAAAAASSGSNGSPETAAPSTTRRARASSSESSSPSAAPTDGASGNRASSRR